MSSVHTFASNCTLPPEGVKFFSAPKIRGTLNIVWSCLSILLLCTYKILHLNVPVQSIPRNSKERAYRSCFRFLDKIWWMLLSLVAPEFIIAKAWCDNKSVDLVHGKLEELAANHGVPWTRKHTHLANMGGFSIKFNSNHDEAIQTLHDENGQGASAQTLEIVQDVRELSLPTDNNGNLSVVQYSTRIATNTPEVDVELASPTSSQTESVDQAIRQENDILALLKEAACEDAPLSVSTLQQRIEKRSGYVGDINWKVDPHNLHLVKEALRSLKKDSFTEGAWRHFLSVWPSWYRNLRALQGDLWILDAQQLLLARELGIIKKLPTVAEADIDDRNKSDIFVFLVAIWQIVWFGLQLIVRWYGRKSTSQLEIITLSFAIVAAVTYYLLKDTPKDIAYSIILPAYQHPRTKEELVSLGLRGPYLLIPRILMRKVLLPPLPHPQPGPGAWFDAQQRSPGRFKTIFSDYIGTLGISNFDFHVNQNLESQNADYSVNAVFVGILSLVVFGAIDFIPWGFSFPTAAEKWLWRVCSILGVAVPVYATLGRYHKAMDWAPRFKQKFAARILPILTGIVEELLRDEIILIASLAYYLFARSFILVEVFRSLAYVPPDAFETSWPANLPHIG